MNTITALEMNALRIPDEECLEFEGKVYTWQQLDEETNRYAKGFADRGIRKGDHIGVYLRNSDDFIILSYAIWKLGAVVVPIHYRSAVPEVGHIIENAHLVAIICEAEYLDIVEKAKAMIHHKLKLVVSRGASTESEYECLQKLRASSPKPIGTHIRSSDTAEILYTHGVVGKPKGALFTHSQVMDCAVIYERISQMTRRDVYVVSVPLCHGLALNAILLMAAVVGGKLIVQEQFDANEVIRWFAEKNVTHFFGVPSMYHSILEVTPPNFTPPKLKSMSYGAAPMPNEIIEQLMNVYKNVQFFNAYGTTESGPTGLVLLPTAHYKYIGKTGKSMPLTAVKVVNEYMEEVPAGVQGEIIIKSPAVMKEYYNDPGATFTMMKNGWLFTGDLAVKDEKGYITVVGRKENTILSGGETIHVVEIEQVLSRHPKVQDVVIMGIPDEVWGEIVVVTIVPREGEAVTEEELVTYCKEHLASYKIPKKFKFLEELPRSTSGKLLKDHLKQLLKTP